MGSSLSRVVRLGATAATSSSRWWVSASQRSKKGLSILTIAGLLLSMGAPISLTGFNIAHADTTSTLFATTPGYISQWAIVGTGLVSGNCSSNYITTTTTNNRSAFTVDLSSIPNGSTITSVAVSATDRETSGDDGTYRTFARLNGSNTDAGSDLAASSGSGCTLRGPQILNVSDTVKSGATTLEIGVFKTSGDTSGVRIGSVRAVVTYTLPTYTITTTEGAGGDLDPEGSVVVTHGNDEDFDITPDAGYIVADVSVDSVSQGRINEYTFNNVAANHSLSATFDGGWSRPTDTDNDGSNGVSDETDAFTSNNDSTQFNHSNDFVEYDEFGLSIPTGSTINGVEVALEGRRTSNMTLDVSLSSNNGGSFTSGQTVTFTGDESTVVLGSSSDLWGRSWSASDFDNNDFHIRVDANNSSGDTYLDQIQVKVHYTLAPATVIATKIVCDAETDLPNWGGEGNLITSTTASDFLAAHEGSCHAQAGWDFQWAPEGTSNPVDNTEAAGSPWTTFTTNGSGVATAQFTVDSATDEYLWVREVLQENYLGFTGNENAVSAEMYCSLDGLGYDNYDRVDAPVAGGTYYCVAFNAPAFGSLTAAIATVPDQSGETFGISSTALELAYPMTDSAAGNDAQVFSSMLTAGVYDLVASPAPTGWVADGASCSDGSDPATVNISAGEDVTCTFTYKRLPILTVYKYASPLDTSFDITVTNDTLATSSVFTANVAGTGEANSGSMYHFTQLGDYTLTEVLPEGWGANGSGGVTSSVCYKNGDASPMSGTSINTSLAYGDVTQCIFNNTPNSIIAGDKFEDLDGKGPETAGHGLSGWTIRLFEWDGGWDLKDSEVTDAGGMYNFGNIQPGKYLLCEQEKSGWYQSVPTTGTIAPQGAVVSDCFNDVTWGSAKGYTLEILDTPVATTTVETEEGIVVEAVQPEGDDEFPGQVFDGFRFGNYQKGSIGGFKWHDTDANGVLCTEEMAANEECVEEQAPNSNWYISFTGPYNNGGEWTSAGTFSFANLEPGTYTLSEQMKEDWVQAYPYLSTGNQTHTVVVQSGDHKIRNFGNVEDSVISGQKWNDVDGDGIWDEGETAPSQDFTFQLYKIIGETETLIDTVTDNADYSFAGLLPGTYRVVEAPAEGWQQTYPTANEGSHVVTVGINDESTGNNFGNVDMIEIYGYKFNDLNHNAAWQDGESSIEGWTITATPMKDVPVCQTIEEVEVCEGTERVVDTERTVKTIETDEDGQYEFQFLPSEAGIWRLSEENRAGWSQTYPTESSFFDVTVTTEGEYGNYNFGNWQWPVVEIFKWNDLNSDGLHGEDETAVADYPVAIGRKISQEGEEGQDIIDTEIVAMSLTGSNGFASIPLNPEWFGGFSGLENAMNQGLLVALEGQQANWTKTFPNFVHNDTINLSFRDGLTPIPMVVDSFFDIFTEIAPGQPMTTGLQHDTYSPIVPLHFGNHFTAPVSETPSSPTPPSGGGNGPIVGSFGVVAGGGLVLGASTSTVPGDAPMCSDVLLTQYMRRGRANNSDQVKKLQSFLNGEMNSNLPTTGFFGLLTENAVKAFQVKYAADILTPWGLTEPTGFVYKTTQRWINIMHCASLDIPMPDLTPFQGE